MTAMTVLAVKPELDLSEFELDLQIAVTGASALPLGPEAGFTKLTCASSSQTSTIVSCVDELGPICCA